MEFYNSDGGWDFDEGELDKLHADPNAKDLDYAVPFVEFEGTVYVADCTCWHERAERILAFLDDHAIQVANYLMAERQRKIKEASRVPLIKEWEKIND